MPNYPKNDVRHADHKKMASEVKRIEKLEKKAVKAAKHAGKKSGKPAKYKSHKKAGNKALRNVQTSGVMDQRGIRVPFNEALPSIMNSTDGKLEIQMRKTLNPGLAPDAGTDIKSINNGISVRTSKAARQWLRHKPHFSSLNKMKKSDLTVYIKNRANKQWSGIYGVTYMSSSKLAPPDTVEKLKNHTGTKWANITESIRFDIPIDLEKNKTAKLVRNTTPVGLVVDGTTDLKEAFDIDEYDWGYIFFWTQGVVGSTGAPITTATPIADPMIKGSWYLSERTDDGDTAAAPIIGARFAHFRTFTPDAVALTAFGAMPITNAEVNLHFTKMIQIGGTLPINKITSGVTDEVRFAAAENLKCAVIHSIVVRNATGLVSVVGFTVNPSRPLVGNPSSVIDVLLDTATGNDGRRRWGETGNNNEMLGAVASAGDVTFLDLKTGEYTDYIPQAPALREIYVSTYGGTGSVYVEHDFIFVELPSDFGLKKKPDLNEKEDEFERRIEQRMKELEDRLGRPKAIHPPPLRSLSETRKQKLAQAVSGEISPTPSVVADLKGNHFSLYADGKDSKDEKTSKK